MLTALRAIIILILLLILIPAILLAIKLAIYLGAGFIVIYFFYHLIKEYLQTKE